jgi:CHAD domain-containing protein
MAYRLRRKERVAKGIRRIVQTELDAAIEDVERLIAGDGGTEELVHDARKRIKKVRAATRLVRGPLGDDARVANALARDAAHCLAGPRDAQVAPRTHERVTATLDAADRQRLETLRAPIRARTSSSESLDTDDAERARALLADVRERSEEWSFSEKGVGAVRAGLERVYRRGRKRLAAAVEHPTPTALHELRKRVKDLWYHVRLIEKASPTVLHPLRDALHDLEDALGDDHDLWALVTVVRELPEAHRRPEVVDLLEARAGALRDALQEGAFRLAERIYAERPAAFGRRVAGYVSAWHDDGPEVPVGPIEQVIEARAA